MSQRVKKGPKPGSGRCNRCGSYFALWAMTKQEPWPGQAVHHCEGCWQALLRESDRRHMPVRTLLRDRYPEQPAPRRAR